MTGQRIFSLISFSSQEAFEKEVKRNIVEVLKRQIKLLGIEVEDLEDINAIKKYKIGRDDYRTSDGWIVQIARAMGINLVQTVWKPTQAIITTPTREVDYSITKLYIASMPQKPKDEQPQA